MSSHLVWEPALRKKQDLSTELKFALHKSYGSPVSVTLTAADLPYLRGLRDAEVKDADVLMEAIEKHGEIVVVEEF